MTFPILGANSAVGGYAIDNSLRFNDGDSPRLDRTSVSSPTDSKIFTYSVWLKKTSIGSNFTILDARSGTNRSQILFRNGSNEAIRIVETSNNFSSFDTLITTNALYRDVSAWYHVLIKYDSTNGTANNRFLIYVNGVEQSLDINTSVTLNYTTPLNEGNYTNDLGHADGAEPFDGYIAEAHFIDGQALSPTDFGEFDEDSGIWKPIQYSGSYGTNGFYLDFENSGSLGADQSGNGNNFTPTNLASTDQTTDTPTNNFNTLNPLSYLTAGGGVAWSEGNCRVEMTSNATDLMCNGTFAVSSGKWYFEWKVTDLNVLAGIHDADAPLTSNNYNNSSLVYIRGGSALQAPVDVTGLTSIATNDILSMFVDLDNFTVKTAVNGVDDGYTKSIEQKTYTFGNCTNGSSSSSAGAQFNFGNPSFTISSGNSDANGYGNFEYSPNDGTYDYLALCTQNLATALSPTIDDGSEYFNTVLYTGTSTTDRTVTGIGFQPDFTWFKGRTPSAIDHALFDSNRGATKILSSNNTNVEITVSESLKSFDSDGVTLGNDLGDYGVNNSARTYALWSWKSNAGSTSSNTDGSITSTVQANTTAGFSIVTYTGTGSVATVGHGLGKAPAMMIFKNRDAGGNYWRVYHQSLGATKNLVLNGTFAQLTETAKFNDTEPTSSVFTVGNDNDTNASSQNILSYCFAEIEGYSKFGSFTGNSNSDNVYIHLGFRPSFFMYKVTDTTGNWIITDSARDSYNYADKQIYPNLSNAESSVGSIYSMDLLSSGVKIRNSGVSGNHIYMAFAENPFVTSGGLPVTAR
jgi:hypothetical protein